jgi:hypothetical protein
VNQNDARLIPDQDLDPVGAFGTKHESRPAKWICGAPHIRSYVSGLSMWRRAFAGREFAGIAGFAAT